MKKEYEIIRSTYLPVNKMRKIAGEFLGDGPREDLELRGLALVFSLSNFIQEIAIAVADGDANRGMEILSSAINESQPSAIRTLESLND